MDLLLPGLLYGLVAGAILAIAALGFNLQFGVTNYANFAYAPFLTVAAYAQFTLATGPLHLNFWIAEVGAVLATALLSFLVGHFVFTPFFRRRPQLLFGLAVTFSVGIMLDALIVGIFGSYVQDVTYPAGALAVHSIAGVRLTNLDFAFVIVAGAILLITHLLLRYTSLGRTMRAMSDNESLAVVCGLPTQRTTAITWALTGALAGVAGLAYQLQLSSFDPTMGDQVFYVLVAAVVFGGIGRPLGAVVGAVVVGLVSQLSVLVVGEAYSTVSIFIVLVVVMLVRPDGLFGTTGRSVFAQA